MILTIKKLFKSLGIMALSVIVLSTLMYIIANFSMYIYGKTGFHNICVVLASTAVVFCMLALLLDKATFIIKVSKTLYYISAVFMPAIIFGIIYIIIKSTGGNISLFTDEGSFLLYSMFMAIILAVSCAIIILVRLFILFRNKFKKQ